MAPVTEISKFHLRELLGLGLSNDLQGEPKISENLRKCAFRVRFLPFAVSLLARKYFVSARSLPSRGLVSNRIELADVAAVRRSQIAKVPPFLGITRTFR